ncbi:MAG TPA: transporter [Blastocatellia bacterium]
MSRLDFAPKINDIKVTDIKRGLGEFVPKPDKAASFDALKATLKKAGYALASAEIAVAGTLVRDGPKLLIEAGDSKQRFALEGDGIEAAIQGAEAGAAIEITGDWQAAGERRDAHEVIRLAGAKKIPASSKRVSGGREPDRHAIDSIQASLGGMGSESDLFFSSVRTPSPGLTVYKGGAVIPRYFFARQRLGDLKVDRHALRFGLSYTPTQTLQLEAEVPYQATSFDNRRQSGSGSGFGNITVWGKYRFYRALETWGDKQAAARIGLELPTGKNAAPRERELAGPEFVRLQLGPIDGGVALHAGVTYSQARGRIIYGANIEATRRGERSGFRMGHEARVNTDLEYVLLPLRYRSPGKELFVLLETSYAYRGRGRAGGREVRGTGSSEFHLAPGLQFTATARLVLEASYQFPVARNIGPLLLRTDRNILVGVRYLY